jgi:hypothetical protein
VYTPLRTEPQLELAASGWGQAPSRDDLGEDGGEGGAGDALGADDGGEDVVCGAGGEGGS